MVNDRDQAQIVAFIHGEMTPLEMQKFSVRIENEAELRAEFEAYLAASDKIEDLLSQPAKEDLSAAQIKTLLERARMPVRRSRRPIFYAGSAVLAASLAFVVFTKLELTDEELKGPPPVVESELKAEVDTPIPPATDAIAGAGGSLPPPAEVAAAPAPEPALKTAEPKAKAKGVAAMKAFGAQQRAEPPAKRPPETMAMDAELKDSTSSDFEASSPAEAGLDSSDESAPSAANEPMAEAPPPPPILKMGVIASKIQVTGGINKTRALRFLQRELDGKTSCSNANIRVVITAKKDGSVSKVETSPKNLEAASCLKARLRGRIEAFKSKAGGKITIQLKIFE